VDGTSNPKIQSIFLPDMPIHTARFTSDGSEVILAGRRKFFYVFNVVAGKVEKVQGVIGTLSSIPSICTEMYQEGMIRVWSLCLYHQV
jgi:hypothetical protein